MELETTTSKDLAQLYAQIRSEDFPEPVRPLPEDFTLRGQVYSQYPTKKLTEAIVDEEERGIDLPSMNIDRLVRMLWHGDTIASVCTTGLLRDATNCQTGSTRDTLRRGQ